MKSMTKFEFWALLADLVGENSTDLEISNWKESAISKRMLLWEEWCRKLGFYKLSLILKSLVIMRTLVILASVSLRYYWEELEYILIKKKIVLQLKNKTYEMSLCRKMSLWREKCIDKIQMLICVITLGESLFCKKDLANIVQFGWLGTSTNPLPSQSVELRINLIRDQDSSWIKIMLKKTCVSRIVLMMELFLWIF